MADTNTLVNMAFIELGRVDVVAECDNEWRVQKVFHSGADITLLLGAHALIDVQSAVMRQQDEKRHQEAVNADWLIWEQNMMADKSMLPRTEPLR